MGSSCLGKVSSWKSVAKFRLGFEIEILVNEPQVLHSCDFISHAIWIQCSYGKGAYFLGGPDIGGKLDQL